MLQLIDGVLLFTGFLLAGGLFMGWMWMMIEGGSPVKSYLSWKNARIEVAKQRRLADLEVEERALALREREQALLERQLEVR